MVYETPRKKSSAHLDVITIMDSGSITTTIRMGKAAESEAVQLRSILNFNIVAASAPPQ